MNNAKRNLVPKRIQSPKRLLDMKNYYAQTQYELTGDWTSTVEQEKEFYRKIQGSTGIVADTIGMSYEGNEIFSVTVGNGERSIVVTGGVHRSEPASREAVLMKMRDIVYNKDGKYTDYLSNHKIIFVPTVQPDRPTSRNNAQGLNINRDVYALETPEGQALMSMLSEVKPDIHIDFHERSGSLDQIEFINTNTFDPNTIIKKESEKFVSDIMDNLNEKGYETDYYPSGIIGPGMTVAGAAFLGALSFTPETHLRANSREFRVNAHQDTFDLILDWHFENEDLIQEIKDKFQNDLLNQGDTFTLLNGDNQYYSNATEVDITLPNGYMLENVNAFDKWKEVYHIQVDDGFVPINQIMGRFIPHLLDPQSDMQVVKAERVE